MYLRLVDSHKFKSPVLYIHSDEEEFLEVIRKWHRDLLTWRAENPEMDMFPLGRLDPTTALVDLLHTLTNYFIETSPHAKGRVIATLGLYEEADLLKEPIMELLLETGQITQVTSTLHH